MIRNRPIAMSPSRVIRPAAQFDDDAIWRVSEPVFRAGETYPLPHDISHADAFAYWRASGNEVFVAEDGGRIVGTYYCRLASDRAEARHIQMPRSLQLIKVALCTAHRISKEDRRAPGSRALRLCLGERCRPDRSGSAASDRVPRAQATFAFNQQGDSEPPPSTLFVSAVAVSRS